MAVERIKEACKLPKLKEKRLVSENKSPTPKETGGIASPF